jgi:hypothetical protein
VDIIINSLKSSQAIIYVNVELVSDVLEIGSVVTVP